MQVMKLLRKLGLAKIGSSSGITRVLASRRFARTRTRRILFVYRFCGLGGVETSTIAKVVALRRIGLEAHIFFSKFYGNGAKDFATLPFVRVGLPKEKELVRLLRSDFDAVFVIDYPGFLDLVFRNEIEIPIVFETHTAIPKALARFYRHLNDPRLQAIIVPSSHNRDLVLERVRPRCEIFVVPNAVDTSLFRPEGQPPGPLLSDLGDREKLVLWVGRLEDAKNPYELIDIANDTLERASGIRFLIVGDRAGNDPMAYERYKARLIERLAVSKREAIRFVRALPYESMPDLFRSAGRSGGLLLSTSLHESLPMIFIEAMASGCPVMSTDVGGVKDLISDGSTGRLYAAGDVHMAATVVRELMNPDNRGSVMQMTLRARKAVMDRHSLTAVAAKYEDILGRVMR